MPRPNAPSSSPAPDGHPAGRLLSLLELLQAQRLRSGTELAALLGVDARTLRRYIAQLQALGIPVHSQRGCDGGYGLRPGYKLPPMSFSADEALALAIGLRAARELGLQGALPAIASTQAKLDRVMPDAQQRRIQAVNASVALDLGRPGAQGSAGRELLTLSAAAAAGQRVSLHYRDRDGQASRRELHPYGIAYRGGAWYLVAWCRLREDLRSFRLDRVEAVEALPASFARPADFDVLDYLDKTLARLPRRHEVELLLGEPGSPAPTLDASLGEPVPDAQGWRLRAQVDDLDWMARELARQPARVRVLAPALLRERLAEHLRRLLADCIDDSASASTDARADGPAPP